MADIVCTEAQGSFAEVAQQNPTQLYALLLKTVEVDADLRQHLTVQALIAAGGNVECDFTNYDRILLTTVSVDPDPTSATYNSVTCDDIVWSNAGGTLENTLAKVVIYWGPSGPDSDASSQPMCAFDATPTTNGTDLTATINANGLYRATDLAA